MGQRVVVNFVALHGGACAYSYEMVKGLIENGCTVLAIISSKMDNYDLWKGLSGIKLFEVSGYSTKIDFITGAVKFILFEKRRIKKAIAEFDPDYVYIPFVSYWTELVQTALKGLPVYYTLHDVYPHDGIKNLIWKSSDRLAKKADKIIVLSKCFVEDIHRNYGLDHKDIIVVPHGNYFNGNVRKKPDDGVFHFVFYGRITTYKGLNVLAEAFSEVLRSHSNVKLLVAGNGDFSPYAQNYDSLDKSKVTIINRWIEDSEVEGFFENERTVCVLPYINATQSGVIPLAMHCKALVVTTNCSGLAEQVENGATGYIVEPNDPMELAGIMNYIIDNWNEAVRIIDNAFSHIQSLNWNNITNIIVSDFENESLRKCR